MGQGMVLGVVGARVGRGVGFGVLRGVGVACAHHASPLDKAF
jgi:hypothetical protein